MYNYSLCWWFWCCVSDSNVGFVSGSAVQSSAGNNTRVISGNNIKLYVTSAGGARLVMGIGVRDTNLG